uniref:Uncharacterized protein n=1 Tax=Xenopus tropicalis TaxID=8364 RepID=A0A6I8SA60_XENTR
MPTKHDLPISARYHLHHPRFIFHALACNKYGSRVLDRMWTASTLRKLHQLQNDPVGHHIARNFALTHFVKRRKYWEERQLGENKRRKMFSEILED